MSELPLYNWAVSVKDAVKAQEVLESAIAQLKEKYKSAKIFTQNITKWDGSYAVYFQFGLSRADNRIWRENRLLAKKPIN